MADVITRFKLETTQYDSALRDASKALSDYSKKAELAGKDFDKFTKGGVEAARALGNIATSATNTKDKVKELVSAYNDVAKAYNKLTEEQKQSDFGKAMASSLEQLQGRIKDAKDEMNSTGGILGQLKDKFTVNIDALKVFSVGLQGAQAALGVARDAFFKNEEQLDTWGRVVEASESLYSGFLDALNTGDISGYLTRIGEITKAAQDAYNALDALNTFNAFNQVNVEKTRTGMTESIADYRSGQGTKEQVKAAGEAYQKELRERQKLEKQAYLEAIKKVAAERGVNGQDLITALSGSYGSYESLKAIPMSGTRTKFTPGGMFGGSTAYEEAYPVNRQEKLGAALRKLNDTELQSLQALGAQAERTGNEIAQVDKQLTRVLNGRQPGASSGGSGGKGGKTTPEYIPLEGSIDAQTKKVQELQKAWRAAADDDSRERIKKQVDQAQAVLDAMNGKVIAPDGSLKALNTELAELNKQRELLNDPIEIEIIDNQIQDIKDEIDQLDGKKVEIEIVPSTLTPFEQLKQSISVELAEDNIKVDETTLKMLMQTAIQNGIDGFDPQFASLQEKMREGINIPDSAWEDLQTQINEKLKGLGIEPIKIDFKTGSIAKDGKDVAKEWNSAANAISSVGSAMQSIEDPSAKIVGTIAQAIATIALTYAQSLKGTFTPWDWIAGAASGMATMMSVISAIHSSTGYAQGGIVKGNSYSGDNIPAMVDGSQMVGLNAGEVVLTKAMTNNLAAGIQSQGMGGWKLTTKLAGTDLLVSLERTLQKQGYGRLATWQ